MFRFENASSVSLRLNCLLELTVNCFLAFTVNSTSSFLFVQASQIATTVTVNGNVTAQYIQKLPLTDCPGFRGQENIGMAKSDYLHHQYL